VRNSIGIAICVLLAAHLFAFVVSGRREASGQAAAGPEGEAILATVQGQGGEPFVFLYEVPTKHLAVYSVKAAGIDLRGVRDVKCDLQIQELLAPLTQGRLTVKDVCEKVGKK
jgi:hypothetical protein